MKNERQKLLVVLGQTATGKSDLAVRLARDFGGEVISADSRQVYKGLDIGTGKVTKREMRGVPHYLLDAISPKRRYTAGDYKKDARKSLRYIVRDGKVPIVCGGTGFYIDALLGAVTLADAPPDETLRKELEKKTTEALFKQLKKLNPKRAKTIDQKNRRRLIRAIEISHHKDAGCPKGIRRPESRRLKSFDMLKIGIILPDQILKEKIAARLTKRLRQGMIAEAKRLHAKGLSWKRMEALGLEYRFLARFLQGKITKEEMVEQLQTATWQYARRQKTWFKRDKEIKWFRPDEYQKVKKGVKNFLKQ